LFIADDELVKRSKAGDIEAFEQLISRYEKRVFTVAYRYLGNREDAADIAQEALIKVYRSLKSFRGDCSFSTWLYRIVTNVCCDTLRKKSKMKVSSLDNPSTASNGSGGSKREVADWSGSPELAFEQKEQAEYIQFLINQLSPEYRMVIVMREIQGFSYEEIAYHSGCSLGTVKSRLSRARKLLRDKISNKEELSKAGLRLPGEKGGEK